jgi:TonB family protein
MASLGVLAATCATNPTPNRRAARGRSAAGGIGCLDTLHVTDSISTIVKRSVTPQDPKDALPPDFEGLFAEEFRSHFKAPPKLPLSVVTGWQPCDSLSSRCAGGVLNVGVVAYVTAHASGELSDIQVVDIALTPDLAESVRAALDAMSEEEEVPPMGRLDSLPLALQISPEDHPDTVPTIRHVFKAKAPHYDSPFSYATMPMAGIDARYPLKARLAGLEDSVTLAFTVESDGTIAPESIDLLSATYGDFVVSVVDALEKTRYHPARLGDCAVATRVKQRFMFRAPQ